MSSSNSLTRMALQRWGLAEAKTTPLAQAHNLVWRVDTPDGKCFVLRAQPVARMSDSAAESQLVWLQAIATETDVVVPQPVALPDGSWHTTVAAEGYPPRRCVLLRWVEGRHVRADDLTPEIATTIGETIGKLHRHARQFRPPAGFDCPRRDAAFLFGPRSFLGGGAAHQHVNIAQLAVLQQARQLIERVMAELGEGREVYGLIHSDLDLANWVFHEGQARPIDFDEYGWGHYLFDLAVPLRSMSHWNNYKELTQALFAGYRRIQPLPQTASHQFEAFVAADFFALLNHNWAGGEDGRKSFFQWLGFHVEMIGRLCRV